MVLKVKTLSWESFEKAKSADLAKSMQAEKESPLGIDTRLGSCALQPSPLKTLVSSGHASTEETSHIFWAATQVTLLNLQQERHSPRWASS